MGIEIGQCTAWGAIPPIKKKYGLKHPLYSNIYNICIYLYVCEREVSILPGCQSTLVYPKEG